MSVGPSSGILGSAAGAPLAQTKGNETTRASQQGSAQQRQLQNEKAADDAAGVGQTQEDQGASERDADGRRLGGGASGDSPEDNPEDDSQPAAKSGLLRRDPRRPPDALGETGQRLDVTV